MNPNLNAAIIEFLANEFHVSSDEVSPDTSFETDFSLSSEEITSLLQRLQEALDFIIPEEKIADIETVGDLFSALAPEPEVPPITQL